MTRLIPRLAVAGALVLLLAGCTATKPVAEDPVSAAEKESVNRLLGLMKQRLDLMHDVARWKWNEGKPVADPERENALLAAVASRAQEKGLDRKLIRSFFAAQIEAAKQMQEADLGRWRAEDRKPFPNPPGLSTLRKKIDEINGKMIESLGELETPLRRREVRDHLKERAEQALAGEGIDDGVRQTAIAPLL